MLRTNDGLIYSVCQLLLHNVPYDKAVLNMMLLPLYIIYIYIYTIWCTMLCLSVQYMLMHNTCILFFLRQ